MARDFTRRVIRYDASERHVPQAEAAIRQLAQIHAMPDAVGRGVCQGDLGIAGAGGSCGTQAAMAAMELAHGTLDEHTSPRHLVAIVCYAAVVHAATARHRAFAWANSRDQAHQFGLGALLGTTVGRATAFRATEAALTQLFAAFQ